MTLISSTALCHGIYVMLFYVYLVDVKFNAKAKHLGNMFSYLAFGTTHGNFQMLQQYKDVYIKVFFATTCQLLSSLAFL